MGIAYTANDYAALKLANVLIELTLATIGAIGFFVAGFLMGIMR